MNVQYSLFASKKLPRIEDEIFPPSVCFKKSSFRLSKVMNEKVSQDRVIFDRAYDWFEFQLTVKTACSISYNLVDARTVSISICLF